MWWVLKVRYEVREESFRSGWWTVLMRLGMGVAGGTWNQKSAMSNSGLRTFHRTGQTRDMRDAVFYDGSHSSTGFFTGRWSTGSCPVVLRCVTQCAGKQRLGHVLWKELIVEVAIGITSRVKLSRKSHTGGGSKSSSSRTNAQKRKGHTVGANLIKPGKV